MEIKKGLLESLEMKCRFCKSPLSTIFANLGTSPLANSFLKSEELKSLNSDLLEKHTRRPLLIDSQYHQDKNKFRKNIFFNLGFKE